MATVVADLVLAELAVVAFAAAPAAVCRSSRLGRCFSWRMRDISISISFLCSLLCVLMLRERLTQRPVTHTAGPRN